MNRIIIDVASNGFSIKSYADGLEDQAAVAKGQIEMLEQVAILTGRKIAYITLLPPS